MINERRKQEVLISINKLSCKNGETIEKQYKELKSLLEQVLLKYNEYCSLNEQEQYRARPDRNLFFEQVSNELSRYDCYKNLYHFPTSFRPFERGKNIDRFIANLVYIQKELNSPEIKNFLKDFVAL